LNKCVDVEKDFPGAQIRNFRTVNVYNKCCFEMLNGRRFRVD
jgi:hypothetical protein